MWYAGQRVICTNDHFSGAIWDWTSTVPREGEVYTIAALERLPQWNTRTPILSFLLQELREDRGNRDVPPLQLLRHFSLFVQDYLRQRFQSKEGKNGSGTAVDQVVLD